jgi:hypothetical protein
MVNTHVRKGVPRRKSPRARVELEERLLRQVLGIAGSAHVAPEQTEQDGRVTLEQFAEAGAGGVRQHQLVVSHGVTVP